jgi:AcrR family transcriptional regulator
MAAHVTTSARESRRLLTRERILGAAIAEFKRSGMAGADIGAIVAAAGVAHGTFYFHFPTKDHVLLELESREERQIAPVFARFLDGPSSSVRSSSRDPWGGFIPRSGTPYPRAS